MRRRLSERGFTLIELLVVITIIAILTGAVVLNIEFRNKGKTIREVALRTGLLMELAADQAVYSRQQLGIRFHPASYEFFILSADDDGETSWTIIDDDRLRFRDVDEDIEIQVDISGLPIVLEELADELGQASDEDPLKPHVMFLSNGEFIPDFTIRIADVDGEYRYQVATGEVQPVVVERLE